MSPPAREKLFRDALEEMVSHLRPDRALVLYARAGEELRLQAGHGIQGESLWTDAPLSLTLFKKVYTTGRPLLTADALKEPDLQDISSLLISGIRAVLCVPVWDASQVRGLLYVDQRVREVAFTEKDLLLLTNLARDLERRLGDQQRTRPPSPTSPAPPAQPLSSVPLGSRSRALLLRSLATMLGAGLDLSRSLSLMARQGEDQATREVCRRMLASLDNGQPLSGGMRLGGRAFSEFQLQLVEVAERSGALVEVMKELARHEEASRALGMRVQSSLTYPLFLFSMCTLLLLTVPPYMLRSQFQMLQNAGVEAPLLTRLVTGGAQALGTPEGMGAVVFIVAAQAWLLRTLNARPGGRLRLRHTLLAIPGLGKSLRMLATTRFARSLALQLRVGVGILQALPAAVRTTGDPVLLEGMGASMLALQEGAALATCLEAADYFPRALLLMLHAGEESGRLHHTLNWLADFYELELDSALQMACAALEPLLMVLMGGAAALVCLSTMLPLIKLVQSL